MSNTHSNIGNLMAKKVSHPVFDYRLLRLLMGLIAFSLPFIVVIGSSTRLSSISASYHTNARDAFVGLLFVVSAFLLAYNGHTVMEAWASRLASVAAALVALFPTSCDSCGTDMNSTIHYGAATVLFSILAFFCFGPFRAKIKAMGGKNGRRNKVYLICGCIMIACMLTLMMLKLTMSDETMKVLRAVYWGEAIALVAFGVAWIVAGKYFRMFVDKEEELRLFEK